MESTSKVMIHMSDSVRVFGEKVQHALTALSESLRLHAKESVKIHDAIMGLLDAYLAAFKAIEEKYNALNGAPGNSVSVLEFGAKDGFYRRYERGAIYYHPQIGAHYVTGAIYEKYLQLGAEAGFLGYPLTDESGTPDSVGRYNTFERGSIHWTPATGAHETHGAIRDKWASLGWETGYLGYPITDEQEEAASEVNGFSPRRISRFQRGVIVHSFESNFTTDLPDTVILASGPLNPDAPITGWVELVMNSAGFFSYRGHLHNSGFVGYHFAVASAPHFQDANGAVLVASEEEHIGGTSSWEDSRDHDWQKDGFEPRIRDNWEALKQSGMTTTLKVESTAGDVINEVLGLVGISLGVVAAGVLMALLASGNAKACPPRGYFYQDPVTGEEREAVSIPIRSTDPNNPSHDPCKE